MNSIKNITKYLALFCLVATLVACGSSGKDSDFFGEDEEPIRPKVDSTTSTAQNWKLGVGAGSTSSGVVISPALLGTSVYAAATNGSVVKVDAQSGKVVWKTRLEDETIAAGVGVGGGLVLVGTIDGRVFALNQSDGEIAWQAQLSSEILASPVIEADVVVARSGDGRVFGLASYDGEVLWTISRQLPRLTLRGDSEPLIFQGVVVAGFSDGTLAAVEAKTGRALWDFPISFPRGTNEIDRLADVDTKPLLVGENIYVSSYQEVTHSLNIREQRISWSSSVSSFHPISYDSAYLYLSDKAGVVHQVERSSGDITWSQDALRLYSTSAPASVGPYVVVGDGDGTLYVIRKSDGALVGQHGLGADNIVGEPIVDGDTVIFMDSAGALRSLNILSRSQTSLCKALCLRRYVYGVSLQ